MTDEKEIIETLQNLALAIEFIASTFLKQSKEIEELKEGLKIQEHNYQVAMEEIEQRWEDKIKAKIEEVKDGTFDAKIVLQSLLEKE